jgi:hypothetical protein
MKRFSGFILKAVFLAVACLAFANDARAQAEIFDGKPDFAKGSDMGYFIWRDGDEWHVRWTTKGEMRRFSGSVAAEGGELKSLKRIDVETERKVIRPGHAPRTVIGPRGRVRVRGGRPPVVAEREQDRIEKDGDNRIRFLARTDDDIDGFDFKVDSNVTSLRFALAIDNQARAQQVECGRENRKAPSIPFTVRLK